MKRFLLIFSLLFSSTLFSQTTIMTYNIKYDNKHDSINNWDLRKEKMLELINHYQADIVGLQESLLNQHTYLQQNLSQFKVIGVGRDDGKDKGEFSPILYNFKKFQLVETATFWLSDTPEKPSLGWDAAIKRVCTYALLKNKKTKKKIWVFNTHFDHVGVVAREKSAELILKKIAALNSKKYPVILMGDLNLTPEKTPITLIKETLDDAKEISLSRFYGPNGTFNAFNNSVTNVRIDYIFTKYLKVTSYLHIDDRLNNHNHISDHFPVLSTIQF